MITKYSHYWDIIVKPLAQELIEKATVDKGCIEYYVSGMIFAVEHDLADQRGKGLMALNSLIQVSGVFSDDHYFTHIHKDTPIEEIERMKKLGKEIKILLDYNAENEL